MTLVISVLAVVVGLYLFLRFTCGKTRSPTCLIGKTAIVTGGNSGIGFQVALNLASRGCRVILADNADAAASKKKIIQETGNCDVISKHLDLASLSSVRSFAEAIKTSEKRLDILVNNAGIAASSNEHTQDGLHPIMQTNTFGHFLLTHLLIDLLKKSVPSRIVFTSSLMAYTHNLTLQNLNFPQLHPKSLLINCLIFSNSNLCNIIVADGFAEKLKDSGVTSNSLHPGVVRTNIFKESFRILQTSPLIVYACHALILLFGKDDWEGAQTTIHVAVAKELEAATGCHFWDCQMFPKPQLARSAEFCRKLWLKCEELVTLMPDEKI